MHLPPGTLNDVHLDQPDPINTFFWFFESRHDPISAPLAIWLNGGPGSSSLTGLMRENGPCHVNPDSNSTVLNEWSWNNNVNMLYIDQPVHVGFSYDVLKNGTLNQLTQTWNVSPWTDGVPKANNTFEVGTFSSMDMSKTANTTANAGRALWHFLQVWLAEFPEYTTHDDRVSLWTESYGGHYAPAFAKLFQKMNKKIANRSKDVSKHHRQIHFDTIGIINGCIDMLLQTFYFPQMAFNNSYGIQVYDREIYDKAITDYKKPGGCRDLIEKCRDLASQGDPDMYGNNQTVNTACIEANNNCRYVIEQAFYDHNHRSANDIGHFFPDPFPPQFYIGYLNQPWVQSALGVPVNYSFAVRSSYAAFQATGDWARDSHNGYLADIGALLDSGVKIALLYGDRDYICNWYGGESISLNIPYTREHKFRGAGYAKLQTNESFVGGLVRQHGNFSFTRVYQSGHEIPAYQPETAYQVFHRAMFDRDLATGRFSTAHDLEYTTEGMDYIWDVRGETPNPPEPVCYVLNLNNTCTTEQIESVVDGSAVVEDFVVKNTK